MGRREPILSLICWRRRGPRSSSRLVLSDATSRHQDFDGRKHSRTCTPTGRQCWCRRGLPFHSSFPMRHHGTKTSTVANTTRTYLSKGTHRLQQGEGSVGVADAAPQHQNFDGRRKNSCARTPRGRRCKGMMGYSCRLERTTGTELLAVW